MIQIKDGKFHIWEVILLSSKRPKVELSLFALKHCMQTLAGGVLYWYIISGM